MDKKRIVLDYITNILLGTLSALAFTLFIVPNNFAPAGIGGIAVMVQYKLNFSVGYLSLLINIPLCVFAFFKINKGFALRTFVYCLSYSIAYLIMQSPSVFEKLEPFTYNAGGVDTVFPCLIGGMIGGYVGGMVFKMNSSAGGTDIIAKYISQTRPLVNFFWANFILNAVVAAASYFVYTKEVDGVITYDYKPVCLCMLYCFMVSFVGDIMLRNVKEAYRFVVICKDPAPIVKDITEQLNHSATIIDAHGAYSGKETKVIICVVNKQQVVDFKRIIEKNGATFTTIDTINETIGQFNLIKKSK